MTLEEFHDRLAALVDGWYERRALLPLKVLLPAYPLVSGLTDEWAALAASLKEIRIRHYDVLTSDEMEQVVSLLHHAENMVYG